MTGGCGVTRPASFQSADQVTLVDHWPRCGYFTARWRESSFGSQRACRIGWRCVFLAG